MNKILIECYLGMLMELFPTYTLEQYYKFILDELEELFTFNEVKAVFMNMLMPSKDFELASDKVEYLNLVIMED